MPGGSEVEYRIVGEDEADPAYGSISWVSPIAQRLLGGESGDEIDLPDGRAEILNVR